MNNSDDNKYKQWTTKNLLNCMKINEVEAYFIDNNIAQNLLDLSTTYNKPKSGKVFKIRRLMQILKSVDWLIHDSGRCTKRGKSNKYFYCIKKIAIDVYDTQINGNNNNNDDDDDDAGDDDEKAAHFQTQSRIQSQQGLIALDIRKRANPVQTKFIKSPPTKKQRLE